MYPYIVIGSFHLGTFGLLLWLAAVAGTVVLHKNFVRNGVDGDALNVVAFVVIAGVAGAKIWHELQNPTDLRLALVAIGQPGWKHPTEVVLRFLHWFQAGFAWFGGMLAGIAMLLWQGIQTRFKSPLKDTLGKRLGGIRMLDLAAPAAAVGYGVGRIGCLTSGDGDYGRNTTSAFWGVHMRADALVPPNPPTALVLPTPLWEFAFALLLGWLLWQLGKKAHPVGWMTGLYLAISGCARFLVEFERINPKLYWGMSNAQVAAIGSIVVGALVMAVAAARGAQWAPELADDPRT